MLSSLTENAKPLREICVGHEWSFGKNRAGNLALLSKLGTRHHFNVVGIPPVNVNGAVVSSTAIRARIERGDFAGAAVMLGRDYTILGTVRPRQSKRRWAEIVRCVHSNLPSENRFAAPALNLP